MTGRNPWAVLGVAEDATYLEIRRAYRRRVKQTHPDGGGDAGEFASVVHAFRAVRRELSSERCHRPTRATPYDPWLSATRWTRSWTESTYPTSRASSTAGDHRVAPTVPGSASDFSAVLRRELSRAGSVAAGH